MRVEKWAERRFETRLEADTPPQCERPLVYQTISGLDCDYYSSTMDVLSFLLPELTPNGCLFYFDDISINFYSDKTGEMKLSPK
jgi:hypothetical protein